MNRFDIIDAAIEHALQPARLHAAALRAFTAATWRPAATHLSRQPAEVVPVGAGRLVMSEHGITGFAQFGVQGVHVSWAELAACLAAVVTAELVNDLGRAVEVALASTNPDGTPSLHDVRVALAHRAAVANGLARRSMFADGLSERTVVDRRADPSGWRGRVTLDPLDPDTVECRVNGHLVAELFDGDTSSLLRVSMLSSDPSSTTTLPGWVRLPPAPDADATDAASRGRLTPCFADRVGFAVIDDGPHGCYWALQVDKVDVVLMEAAVADRDEAISLHWTVYDDVATLDRLFDRHTGQCTVPRQPPRYGRRDGGTAANRDTPSRRPSEGPGR